MNTATSRNESHELSAVSDMADDDNNVKVLRETFPERRAAQSISGRRNPIATDVWQDTLALLCEANYRVRADYARALTIFIQSEIPREHGLRREHTLRLPRPSPLVTDASTLDCTTRFLHALHASAYALATSPALGISPTKVVPFDSEVLSTNSTREYAELRTETDGTDELRINVMDFTSIATPLVEVSHPQTELGRRPPNGEARRGSSRSRTPSLPLSLLEPISTSFVAPSMCSANISDYGHLVAILSSAYERTPSKSLLCGVPMLFMLDEVTCPAIPKEDKVMAVRRRALREVIAEVWSVIGQVLDSQEIKELAETVSIHVSL